MRAGAETVAVVPTLARSPFLRDCLEALRRQGDGELAIVVVVQGSPEVELPAELADRVVRRPQPVGFSRATNLGLESMDSPLVATVNDDAIVENGWLEELRGVLLDDETIAAAQGTNLRLDEPDVVDGRGLRWNRWWQAVQIDHGRPLGELPSRPLEVFGTSATAALYRRRALERVALAAGSVFDPELDSYYEDVDLACRLRSAGLRALYAPAARARHAGAASAAREQRLSLVYGNRYLVAARFLGRSFWPRLPLLVLRDVLDLLSPRGAGATRAVLAGAVLRGWRRALRRLHAYAHGGRPGLPLAEAHRPPGIVRHTVQEP